MKKFLSLVFGLIMCLGCGIALAACGKVTLKSITIDSGLNRSVLVGEELDTSNVVATVKWSDGKTATITSADLEFSEIDTTKPGTKELTITYTKEDYTFVVKIKVGATDAEVESIIRMESKLLTQYNANVGVSQAEKTGFKDDEDKTAKRIYVGDDNAFNFRIAATGIDSEGEDIELASLQTTVTVKLVEGETKTTLTGDALKQYVSVNPTNAVLDFTEDAIGHVFEVTVDAVKKGGYPVKPFTATLTVVDGFNVYDALDLSVYDNKYEHLSAENKANTARNHYGYVALHAQVMAKYGMTAEEIAGIKAMILQNNITLHRADVPAEFFWQQEFSWSGKDGLPAVTGTLINHDSDGIYYRFVEDGDTFSFIGNYFKIDTSEFPRAVVQTTNASSGVPGADSYVNSDPDHLSAMQLECQALFYTTGNEKEETGRDESEAKGGAQIYWKNLAFNGNGELTNDPKNSGSLLLSKFVKSHSYINNNIVTNHYIAYLVRKYKGSDFWQHKTTAEIVDCKGYSCYQCLVYVAGTDEGTIIKDSEFVGANGPAIIADYLRDNDLDRHIPVYLDIINSKIESKITGKEQWFITYGASDKVAKIVGLEQALDGTNEDLAAAGLKETPITIVSKNASGAQAVNAAVLCKLDSVELEVSERMNGKIRFFDTQAQYEAQAALQAAFEQELAAMLLQASQKSGQEQTQFVLTQAQALAAKYKKTADHEGLVYGLDMDRTYTWFTMGKDLWNNYARDMAIAATKQKIVTENVWNGAYAQAKQAAKDQGKGDEEAATIAKTQADAYIASDDGKQMIANGIAGLTAEQIAQIEAGVDAQAIKASEGIADFSLGKTIFVESDASMGYLSLGKVGTFPQMSALPTQAGPVGAFFADADTQHLNVYLENGMAIILQASPRTAA